ncbi:MAG: T9SS type A sorting domain-containing protein [Salinivenus sp.]
MMSVARVAPSPLEVLVGLCLLIGVRPAGAQHFTDCLTQNDTGTSATVVVEDTVDVPLPNGASLENGDEIALVTDDGVCAGKTVWDADAPTMSTAAVGPGSSIVPDSASGYALDEQLRYRLWDASAGTEYDLGPTAEYAPCAGAALCRSDGRYENDVLFTVTGFDKETLPVELAAFDATVDGRRAVLRWATLSETNNAGFAVLHRSPSSGAWTREGFVDGHGTTSRRHAYQFSLESLTPGRHEFRLRQVDAGGQTTLSEPVSVVVRMETAYTLSPVVPSPVRDQGRLTLRTRQTQRVEVALFNTLGQRVTQLRAGRLRGQIAHTIRVPGGRLPSGTYLVRVEGESFTATRKAVVVR